jgi:hypothetical protein
MTMKNCQPLAILNGAIVTADGEYSCRTISLQEARDLVQDAPEIVSAVGHEATAELLTELFNRKICFNRINFQQAAGQDALVFKLNRRSPEGVVLTKAEIEKIGYQFQLLSRIS